MTRYSICICNYNMADTIPTALGSVLSQLDDRFEVVVLDDGSSDDSVAVLKSLQKKYPFLRIVELQRDASRQLGFTRNKSVEEAKSEYVLLHLDCDDIAAPYIKDFINVFHQIEAGFGRDILLSGNPIQMGKRDFLLQHGPYRNINRGEDRDMYARFAAIDAFVPLEMKSFKTILPKTRGNRLYRSIYYTFDALRNVFRSGEPYQVFLYREFKYQKAQNLKTRILRLVLSVPAWMRATIQGPLEQSAAIGTPEEMKEYKARVGGTFAKIMRDHGKQPDWSEISPPARAMFEF